jgi:pimeloyl-ACP methyl ester carboxylesterase
MWAMVAFPEITDDKKLPLMIVQHGYLGNRSLVSYSAKRMAQRGYMCLCLDMRGWLNSGKHDDGGIEIMDIYDGIEALKKEKYGKHVDFSRISMIGYSNGGGNTFFAAARFPFLFRNCMALFGIPNYGQWITLNNAFRKKVIEAVGGTPEELPDKYMCRNATLAAGNARQTRFHIAYDEAEKLCPIVMDTDYVNAAIKAGNQNVFIHVSKITDKNRWIHGYNTEKKPHLSAIEDLFLADIEQNKAIPQMPEQGKLTVLGFVITPKFRCFLGKGDDAVAEISYKISENQAEFQLKALSSDSTVPAIITLTPDSMDKPVTVKVDQQQLNTIMPGNKLEVKASLNSKVLFSW